MLSPPPSEKKGKLLLSFPLPNIPELPKKYSMDQSKEGSKTTEGATLQQVLKKWKKLAAAPKDNSKKSIKFLKKTLSFSNAWAQSTGVPKGFLAVCVGEEMKRFVIPTDFLHHKAFQVLLREAEEEYGFRQEGVLRIPCQVAAFERILEMVQKKKEGFCYISPEVEAEMAMYHLHLPHKMMCR